jgi:hypothetical protein
MLFSKQAVAAAAVLVSTDANQQSAHTTAMLISCPVPSSGYCDKSVDHKSVIAMAHAHFTGVL